MRLGIATIRIAPVGTDHLDIPVAVRIAPVETSHLGILVEILHVVATVPYTNATIDAVTGESDNPFMRNLTTYFQFAIVYGDGRPDDCGQNCGGET